MADPNWTAQYQFNLTPEQNGFTRVLYNSPIVTLITSGAPANRRVEVNSSSGDVVFELSNVPSLNLNNGATVEMLVAVSGLGDAGFELTFQTTHFGLQVYSNRITLVVADGEPEHEISVDANSGDVKLRATITPGGPPTLRIYRNDILIDTRTMPGDSHPLPRVLFWAEGGGTQIFRKMSYFLGGPFAP